MGVPKFFRWLSERYPKINQRAGFLPEEETCQRHFNEPPPSPPLLPPDELSTCGLSPPTDRLYIDMNGVIHGCSHNNLTDDDNTMPPITHEEIFQNIAYYLDRIIGDIVQPTQLVYMSIDGVAPRAKLNQQRSRRYRSGNEGEIEETIYEAHLKQRKAEREAMDYVEDDDDERDDNNDDINGYYDGESTSYTTSGSFGGESTTTTAVVDPTSLESLQEVEPGRFTGKFESHTEMSIEQVDEEAFHHNAITPGTEFFAECTEFLETFIREKLKTDPKWQHLDIIFSGSNVPGEGEHKIMDFIRREKYRKDYNPNIRHCIMGQDGDWIMLGLATHEPNLVLLREQVVFHQARQRRLQQGGIDAYAHNPNFEWLHMGILRDYLAYEFETSCVVPENPYDLEATIDDFVFLTFFVGNDFLPHMPALDIADEAFDLLFYVYKKLRSQWHTDKAKNNNKHPYLTHAGNIVSGKRLEQYLQHLGGHELPYYDNKKRAEKQANQEMRQSDVKAGRESTIPDDEVLQEKEEADRARYREMIQSMHTASLSTSSNHDSFSPVVSKRDALTFRPADDETQDAVGDDLASKMSTLLQLSVKRDGSSQADEISGMASDVLVDDQDLKGRYYYDKFGFTPFDAQKHIALRKAYIRGLVWTLKYYYEGCVSWEWFYPYHYGPMLSDLVNIDEILSEISFDHSNKGEPIRPFEQLMGCMPPSSAHFLPKPYRWLLTDPNSPLVDFYPRTFTVDMNGKRWPWEAVVLLPFIDSERLITAARGLVTNDMLTEEERRRNVNGHAWVFSQDGDVAQRVPLQSTKWDYQPDEIAVLRPELPKGVRHPQPGFPTLKDAPIQSLWRRDVGINVFGMRSRYRTCLLVLGEVLPKAPKLETLGKLLIGTTVFINYPFLSEAFVTAVSNSEFTMRGKDANALRRWDRDEALVYQQRSAGTKKNQAFGEKMTGTGGWIMPEIDIMVSARPLKGLTTLPDGTKARIFAKFEVELPLIAAIWAPSYEDTRLSNTSALLEREPYSIVDQEEIQKKVSAAAASTLLPKEEEAPAKEPEKLKSVPTPLPGADPYAPPFILFAFEDQDPPVMHAPHEEEQSSEPQPIGAKEDLSAAAASSLLAQDEKAAEKGSKKSVPPHLPGSDGDAPPFIESAFEHHDPTSSEPQPIASQKPQETSTLLPHHDELVSDASNGLTALSIEPSMSQATRTTKLKGTSSTAVSRRVEIIGGSHKGKSGTIVSLKGKKSFIVKIDGVGQALKRTGSVKFVDTERIVLSSMPLKEGRASVASRGFTTSSRRFTNRQTGSFAPGTRSFSSARQLQFARPVSGNTRVRLLSLGAAAAAAAIASNMGANAIELTVLPFRKQRVHTFSSRLADVRGGYQDLAEDNSAVNPFDDVAPPPLELAHGTTTLSFVFDGGIVAAVDSRASLGNFVGSKTTQKVLAVNSHMLGTMAGGAADCSYWIRKLRAEAQFYELTEGKRMSVVRASRILSNALYDSRSLNLSIGTMIMGFDPNNGGPRIYYVDNSGVRLSGDLFAVGSGSTFALGILDTARRKDMTEDEAIALGIKAIRHATFRDAFSGGYIGVYVINKDGWRKVFSEDLARSPTATK